MTLLFLFFLLTPAFCAPLPVNSLTTLTFPPDRQHVTGGNAQHRHLIYPRSSVTCVKYNDGSSLTESRYHCKNENALYSIFLHIHHARVHCEEGATSPEMCNLDYQLDFTFLSVFILGFVATALCGGCMATAMWLAVVRLIPDYSVREEREPSFYKLDIPGYGSFGRKLSVVGGFSGSFSSLADFSLPNSPPDSPPASPPMSPRRSTEAKRKMDFPEMEIYLG